MEVHLVDFPNIVLTTSELLLPFQSSMKIEKIGSVVLSSTEPLLLLYNMFDDWLAYVSSYTAFSRLILILRALHVNVDKARILLRPDSTTYSEPQNLWPSFSDSQWIAVEQSLKDLIIDDY